MDKWETLNRNRNQIKILGIMQDKEDWHHKTINDYFTFKLLNFLIILNNKDDGLKTI